MTVSIAQFGSTRSINAGVAAGIAMHAWIRQHADLSRAWYRPETDAHEQNGQGSSSPGTTASSPSGTTSSAGTGGPPGVR